MTNRPHTTESRASVPAMGSSLPTAAVHLAHLVVAAPLCVIVLQNPFWIGIGLLLALATTFLPNIVPKPWLLLVLGVSQFWREPTATDVAFYLLLAGLHLLHILGSLTAQVPWRGRIQRAALLRPIRQFIAIQVVVQAVAVGALFTFDENVGTIPGLALLTAALLAVVALVLARGLYRARSV
jgi:hypothetical protein